MYIIYFPQYWYDYTDNIIPFIYISYDTAIFGFVCFDFKTFGGGIPTIIPKTIHQNLGAHAS